MNYRTKITRQNAFGGEKKFKSQKKTRRNHLGGEKRPWTTRDSPPNPFWRGDPVKSERANSNQNTKSTNKRVRPTQFGQ